jgi:predicted O-methyltransferase YrrM
MTDSSVTDDFWFTQDWLEERPLSWSTHLRPLAECPNIHFLEIGCFEGRATVWLLLNVLTHPTARIDCIDTFDINYKFAPGNYESRFDYNVLRCGTPEKVTKLRGLSQEILRKLPASSYDCIYIDGSHAAIDVLQDAVLSFLLLKPRGILIFDDYEWEMEQNPILQPRIAIDAFLQIYKTKYALLEKAYQVIIRKL